MKRFVITGTGRSGTRYMSVLLTRMGIPCGHQTIYNSDCAKDDFVPPWGNDLKGDSSGLAAPFVLDLPEDTLIIHLVRNPAFVIKSLITQKHLPGQTRNTSVGVYEKFCPDIGSIKDLKRRAAVLWVQWNMLVERAKDRPFYALHRIEDHPMRLIRDIAIHIGWHHVLKPETVLDVATDIGSTGKTAKVSLRSIKGPAGRDLREMAERYGYETV